jgi:hypothetical protein
MPIDIENETNGSRSFDRERRGIMLVKRRNPVQTGQWEGGYCQRAGIGRQEGGRRRKQESGDKKMMQGEAGRRV